MLAMIMIGIPTNKKAIPSKLRISQETVPCLAHVCEQGFDFLANESVGNLGDGLADLFQNSLVEVRKKIAKKETHDFIPPPNRERHSMTHQIR